MGAHLCAICRHDPCICREDRSTYRKAESLMTDKVASLVTTKSDAEKAEELRVMARSAAQGMCDMWNYAISYGLLVDVDFHTDQIGRRAVQNIRINKPL